MPLSFPQRSVMRYFPTASQRTSASGRLNLYDLFFAAGILIRYGYDWAGLWLIATFPSRHYDIEQYPAVKKYLLSYGIERLEQTGKVHNVDGVSIKARKKTNNKWFETQDSISYWEDFFKPKIVWARLMRISKKEIDSFPRFCAVEADTFVVDSLCFFTGNDIVKLCNILNSNYAAYYFFRNIAILDNGGMQMRQQYIEGIPIPLSLKCKENINDNDIFDAFSFTDNERDFIIHYVRKRYNEILNSI